MSAIALASVGSQWNRVTPRATAPQWLKPALEAIAKLRNLQNNWDGYGSPPLREAALRMTDLLMASLGRLPLPMPQIYPVTGGGISFSWQLETRELDIEILPDASARYLAVEAELSTGQETAREGPLEVQEYPQFLAEWLIGQRPLGGADHEQSLMAEWLIGTVKGERLIAI